MKNKLIFAGLILIMLVTTIITFNSLKTVDTDPFSVEFDETL